MSDLRTIERESIRDFIEQAGIDGYLAGRVLDYGCGKQPYRSLVESFGAEYVGFDRAEFPANVSGADCGPEEVGRGMWDVILCTQVVQYVPIEQDTDSGDGLQGMLSWWDALLEHYNMEDDPPRAVQKRGHLILTYPTNWPEVEKEDLHRFTKAGMERLLTEAGFEIVRHERRAEVPMAVTGELFALGYGVIARA